MYDIPTKAVSRLNGELSTAFVKVAESNASAQDLDGSITDSGIVEQMTNQTITEEFTTTTGYPDLDMEADDMDAEAEGSEHVETVVKYESAPTPEEKKPSFENKVMISSGYSVIKS